MSDTHETEQARGSLKEALGKITGDAAVEAQGRTEKRVGKRTGTRMGDRARASAPPRPARARTTPADGEGDPTA